jgi:protein TonB
MMFEDCLMESSRANRDKRRYWSSMLACVLQASLLAAMLAYPLLHPDVLPSIFHPVVVMPVLSVLIPPPAPAHPSQPSTGPAISIANPDAFRQPSVVPHTINMQSDASLLAPANPFPAACVLNCSGNSNISDIVGKPIVLLKPSRPVVISHFDEGALLRRVQPEYPYLARQTRTEGPVVLQATISREGLIENLRVISGHPLLTAAAIRAVSQWKFRPYVLNGAAIEVETQITVNFHLANF